MAGKMADIKDIVPNIEEPISCNQFYEHMNEGYTVIVHSTNERDATEAISDYLRKKAELLF